MPDAKQDMLKAIDESWAWLQEVLDGVPSGRTETSGVVEAWSVKDLVGHVTTWETQAMELTEAALPHLGEADFRRHLHLGQEVDQFNLNTSESKKDLSVARLRSDMDETHRRLLEFVSGLSAAAAEDSDVQWRLRIDCWEHYAEHGEHIRQWLG